MAAAKVTLENNSLAVVLTPGADAAFMVENPPACGPIPLLWLLVPRSIATGLNAKAEAIFARLHRARPAGRAGGRDRAFGRDRRPRFGAVFQFRRTAAAGAAQQWLVRRRILRAIPAAGAQARDPGFFQGAAAGEARPR